jgi:hypothetical protein
MKHYLKIHHVSLPPATIEAFGEFIRGIPGRTVESAELTSEMLQTDLKMTENEARFLTAWIFDVCPTDSFWYDGGDSAPSGGSLYSE